MYSRMAAYEHNVFANGYSFSWVIILYGCLLYNMRQRQRKILEIGGGNSVGACVSRHTLGGSGGMLPQEKFLKLGALRSPLRYYLYPNITSPTRVHARSNTAVHHDICQSSRGIQSL